MIALHILKPVISKEELTSSDHFNTSTSKFNQVHIVVSRRDWRVVYISVCGEGIWFLETWHTESQYAWYRSTRAVYVWPVFINLRFVFTKYHQRAFHSSINTTYISIPNKKRFTMRSIKSARCNTFMYKFTCTWLELKTDDSRVNCTVRIVHCCRLSIIVKVLFYYYLFFYLFINSNNNNH